MDYQNTTTHNTRYEKRAIKNKTNKNWEKIGATYCLIV